VAVAYLVLAHRLPEQVGRLTARLAEDGDPVFVHVDRKVDIEPFAAQVRLQAGDRPATLVPDRVRVYWAQFSIIEATLRLADAALASAPDVTHLVLLTGQDYPLRPAGEISRTLGLTPDTCFLSWSLGDPKFDQADRDGNARWHWDRGPERLGRRYLWIRGRPLGFPNRFIRLPRLRPAPKGLREAQGLAYWALTPAAVNQVRTMLAASRRIRRYFQTALTPEEFLFQMLLLASPFADRCVNKDLHFIARWEGWHPSVLTAADVPAMLASDKMFARKFDMNTEPDALDLVDAALGASRDGPG
jgi:hypothetical protein